MKRPREEDAGHLECKKADGDDGQQTKRPAASAGVDVISREGGGGGRPSPRLYVGGLHRSVTEGEILKLFLPHGRVLKEDFPFHLHGPRKGEPRGYAFLEFERTAEAARAIAALDGKQLRGRRLLVRYVREQETMPTDPRSFLSKAQAKAKAKAGRPVEKPPSSSSGRGARDGGEESALDAKIRALKAMLQK